MMIGKMINFFLKTLQKCWIMCYNILLTLLLLVLSVLVILLLVSGALALVLLAGMLCFSEEILPGRVRWQPDLTNKSSTTLDQALIKQINSWVKNAVKLPMPKVLETVFLILWLLLPMLALLFLWEIHLHLLSHSELMPTAKILYQDLTYTRTSI